MTIYRIEIRDPYVIRFYDVEIAERVGAYELAQNQAYRAYLAAFDPVFEEQNEGDPESFDYSGPVVEADELETYWNPSTREWDSWIPLFFGGRYIDHPWQDFPPDMTKLIQYVEPEHTEEEEEDE